MSAPPLGHFFGLAERPTALDVLGLPSDKAPSLADIDAAAARRLEELRGHADADSPAADEAKRAIAVAAARLRGVIAAAERPRRGNGGRSAALTQFDQQVLTVLVASGGWNADARARVVGLAAQYGVSVAGLIKVVHGLSEHARQGGARLAVSDILGGATRARGPAPAQPVVVRPRRIKTDSFLKKLAKRLGIDTWQSPIPVEYLLPGFIVLATLVGGAAILWVVLKPPPEVEPQQSGTQQAAAVGAEPASSVPGQPADSPPDLPKRSPEAAHFSRVPTFTGNARPQIALEAADALPALPAYFDEIDRKLAVSREASEAVLNNWDQSVLAMSRAWVLADESTREEVHRTILAILDVAGDTPSLSDRLLGELTPPSGGVREPIDIWRGAWMAGTLGAIAARDDLQPVVTEQARAQLELTIGSTLSDADAAFVPAATLWLAAQVESLVTTTELEDDAYDRWELWLAAQRELGGAGRIHVALLQAVREMMISGGDLVSEGPSVNVVGRLLGFAGFAPSGVLRDGLEDMLADPAVDSTDLWVLTSLLAQHDAASWFESDLILPPTAGERLRRRIASLVDQAWPMQADEREAALAKGRGVGVNANILQHWSNLQAALENETLMGGEDETMIMVVATARLNAAAALLCARQATESLRQLELVEQALTSAREAQRYAAQAGQPIGPDGQWAAEYKAIKGGRDERDLRQESLQGLRSSAGTDLGPIDAEMLVQLVYRGSPRDLRGVAQLVVLEQFRNGPTVALELVDQLPLASQNEQTDEFIRRLTDRLLPSRRSAEWPTEARLALLDHALSLRHGGREAIDLLSDHLAAALILSTRAVNGDDPSAPRLSGTNPAVATMASELHHAWRNVAGGLMVTEPVPAGLSELSARHHTRTRLTRGPVQHYAATQIAIADLMAFVAAAEQPGEGPALREMLEMSQDVRIVAPHILHQALEVERLIARIWAVRMVEEGSDGQR